MNIRPNRMSEACYLDGVTCAAYWFNLSSLQWGRRERDAKGIRSNSSSSTIQTVLSFLSISETVCQVFLDTVNCWCLYLYLMAFLNIVNMIMGSRLGFKPLTLGVKECQYRFVTTCVFDSECV